MHDIREINRTDSPWLTTRSFATPPGSPTRYRLGGELGYRLTRNIDRIERQVPYSTQYLLGQVSTEPGCWCNFPRFHGDMVGRWILAETYIHGDDSVPPPHLRHLVGDLLALQNDDGSFGSVPWASEPLNPEKAYGNGWTLKALAQYALTFDDDAARAAAIRMGQCYSDMAPVWYASDQGEATDRGYASSVSCFYHALDGVMTMHRLTDDQSYLHLARDMAGHLTPLEEADHSHMYLTIRRGLLRYYQAIGDHKAIAALAAELDRFHDRWIMENGGVPERLVEPDATWKLQDEGCSLFDWHLLTLAMHRETGDEKWLRRAILNLENQVYYNQTYNGGFGSVIINDSYPQMGKEAPWCCSLFGPYGLIGGAAYLLEYHNDTLSIHHPVPGSFVFDDQHVTITRDDREGRLTIDLSAAPAIKRLRLATPFWWAWADSDEVADGESIVYREITVGEDRWVTLSYRYRAWSATPGAAPHWKRDAMADDRVVLFFGPWLLNHRHHPKAGDKPLGIHATLRAGLIEPDRVEYLLGLPGSGEGFELRFTTDRSPEPMTTFRWPNQPQREVRFYPLKECESPGHGSSAVTLLNAIR